MLCDRCKREIQLRPKRCQHDATELVKWETSKAFIEDRWCVKCGFATERKVVLKVANEE
jgi:hypothetical protein